jgi:DNA polymerase III subunit epsilon
VRGWFRRTPLAAARWVVIDCETSGLDPKRDRLLSVGAVIALDGKIELRQAFQAKVRQTIPSSRENIVIHGIGGDAQLSGLPLPEVISSLAACAGDAIPAAFHAAFDEGVLRRHGLKLRARWLDLAAAAPALFPGRGRHDSALEHWLAAFDIPALARHDALGDAFATAQLLLVTLSEARRQGFRSVEDLLAVARGGRWLAGR